MGIMGIIFNKFITTIKYFNIYWKIEYRFINKLISIYYKIKFTFIYCVQINSPYTSL